MSSINSTRDISHHEAQSTHNPGLSTSVGSQKNNRKPKGKTTNRRPEDKFPLILIVIICIFFGFFFVWPIAYSLYWTLLTIPNQGQMTWFQLLFAALLAAILFSMVAVPIGIIMGKIRAKHRLAQLNQQVKLTNPYQYYKELPNHFGIGIATLLSNSTIENEKDIIAAILDLCAQGYLHLSKHSDHYVIRPLPLLAGQAPLRNEAYLLDLINQNKLSQLDYYKWYQLCVQDGVEAGLFTSIKFPASPKLSKAERRKAKKATVARSELFGRIYGGVFAVICVLFIISAITQSELIAQIALGLFIALIFLVFVVVVLTLVVNFTGMLRDSAKDTYKETLEQHLNRTEKGVTELQKLLAFREFLSQFNTFVDKNPEAVVLWDRYLSYAQVFGLADQLMKTGYQELIVNAAFKIDNINNISLSKLTFLPKSNKPY